jgi:hypothetical protein
MATVKELMNILRQFDGDKEVLITVKDTESERKYTASIDCVSIRLIVGNVDITGVR